VEPKAELSLSERSAKSAWKEIFLSALIILFVAIGFAIWMVKSEWIGHYNKSIEVHTLPIIASSIILSVIWVIRAAIGFLRSNDRMPMDTDDYFIFYDMCYFDKSRDFPSDWLARWTCAAFLASLAFMPTAASEAPDSIIISIFTIWIPLVVYLSAATFVIREIFFCAELALVVWLWLGALKTGGWWIIGLLAYFIGGFFIGLNWLFMATLSLLVALLLR
jgi:hypothetical protein